MSVRRRWRFYTTRSGRSPVKDFVTDPKLPGADRDEIIAALKDVQVNGLEVARHLHGDLYEVRAEGRATAYRVLFTAEGARSQVLLALSAFKKKTQKTPKAELELAQQRLDDWRRRGVVLRGRRGKR